MLHRPIEPGIRFNSVGEWRKPPALGVLLYGTLALNAALWIVSRYVPDFEARYGFLSWGLALLFLSWLLPAVFRPSRHADQSSTADPTRAASSAAFVPNG